MSERVKESLFSIIRSEIQDAFLLEFFAGTGNVSFEALSRGAARARLVEKSSVSIGLIKDNAELLGVKENIEVIHSDVFDYSENVSPDIFFAGPPYGENLSATILVHAREKKILTPDTLVIIQHHKKDLPGSIGYERIDYREYGITALSFFRLL